jgi:hypothetical protein
MLATLPWMAGGTASTSGAADQDLPRKKNGALSQTWGQSMGCMFIFEDNVSTACEQLQHATSVLYYTLPAKHTTSFSHINKELVLGFVHADDNLNLLQGTVLLRSRTVGKLGSSTNRSVCPSHSQQQH